MCFSGVLLAPDALLSLDRRAGRILSKAALARGPQAHTPPFHVLSPPAFSGAQRKEVVSISRLLLARSLAAKPSAPRRGRL